jgi:ribonuclease H / adenosylcobalamin/alpha-ribazole phosphatase
VPVVYLVRHAACASVGRGLAAERPDPGLDARGIDQARVLASRLSSLPLDAVVSSPRERARQTAAALAKPRGLEVRLADGFREIGFGEWAGRSFAELAERPGWNRWNSFRSFERPPGGESMAEVQARAVGEIERIAEAWPDGTVAVVSHADVIKAVLAYVLGMPIDFHARLEILPASVSVVQLGSWGAKVHRLNDVEARG